MKLAHEGDRCLEYIAPHHQPILSAAALDGIDVDPVVSGATRLIGYGDTKYGYGAACILDIIQTEYVMEPHIIWLPWTKPSQRIAHFKWAMELMAETHHVMFNVEKKQIAFFEHFVKRGIPGLEFRKVGVLEDMPLVEEIHIYQIKRRKP